MSFCCVGGCYKKRGSGSNGASDFRCFIRWYKFPSEPVMQQKWIESVNRPTGDVNVKTMHVCSDHFEDDDFVYSSLLRVDLLLSSGRHREISRKKIHLKEDAIPNVDRNTGLIRIGAPIAEKALKRQLFSELATELNSQEGEGLHPSNPLILQNINEIILDNEVLLGKPLVKPKTKSASRKIKKVKDQK